MCPTPPPYSVALGTWHLALGAWHLALGFGIDVNRLRSELVGISSVIAVTLYYFHCFFEDDLPEYKFGVIDKVSP